MEPKIIESKYPEEGSENTLDKIILSEIPDTEQAVEYLNFAKKIIKYLEQDERDAYSVDPINFCSSKNLFRSFSLDTYDQIKSSKFYKPQSGEQGSEGVYFSNRPYSAFTYQKKGVISVINPTKLTYKSELGILDVSSPKYTETTRNYINRMLPMIAPTNRSDFFYRVQNQWDSARGVSKGPPGEKIIEMRLAQPIEITKIFLVWSEKEIIEIH